MARSLWPFSCDQDHVYIFNIKSESSVPPWRAEHGVSRSSLRTLAALPKCRALANHPELAKVLARMACLTAT